MLLILIREKFEEVGPTKYFKYFFIQNKKKNI